MTWHAVRLRPAAETTAETTAETLGIADTFGDEVVVCREDDDIRGAFFRLSVDRGDAQERALAARQFAAAHSFSSRARTLVEAVVGLRRGAGPGHVP